MSGDYKVSIALSAKVADYVRGMDVAAKATDKLRNAQQGTARSSAELAAELTAAGAAGRASAAGLNEHVRQVRSLERAHKKLNDTRKAAPGGGDGPGLKPSDLLPKPAEARRAGSSFGDTFLSGFSGVFSTPVLGPVVIASLVGAAAAAAPVAGAALAGGLLGGVASAGLGAGIAASLRSPAIKGEISALKADLGHLADGIGHDFESAVDEGIHLLRDGVSDVGPALRQALAPAASYLKPLTLGVEGLVENALPGIGKAIQGAAPVIEVIADELPAIGTAVSNLFSTAADHADEAASAIQLVLNVVEGTINFGADVIDFLSSAYKTTLEWSLAAAQLESHLPFVGGFFEGQGERIKGFLDTANGFGLIVPVVTKVGERLKYGADATDVFITRQKLLNGSMRDGIDAAGGLDAALKALTGGAISAERAEIQYQAAIDAVTASVKKNGHSLDAGTEKGRANRTALLSVADATVQNAQAAYDAAAATGTRAQAEAAASAEMERGRQQLIKSYLQFDNNKARAIAYANSILQIPKSWDTQMNVKTADAVAKLKALGFKVKQLPDGTFTITAETAAAKAHMNEARTLLDALNGRVATMRIYVESVASTVTSAANSAYAKTKAQIRAKASRGHARGGIDVAMAGGGMLSAGIYPASNPPLVKFAEPETGGEAYVPRRGSVSRGRQIVSEAASWYGMRAVPMAGGGVLAAASGLVTVAPHTATRLDSAQAYLQTRDSITSLNEALKKNGHAFSTATAKGRENQGQLFSAIKAAQDAAKTKFDETGNVRLANAAYDAYILRLRQTLVQQKVNRAAIRGLLSFADRPTFAASDSHLNIAAAKSQIGAQGALADLRDSLSLNRPTLATMSKEGRDNLSSILGFIEAAGSAAQDQYAQTGSAKTASALYASLIAELRSALKANGYSATVIAGLVSRFGRISLVPNAEGGVYGPGDTLYQFREPSTGGEAFLPRRGDRARGERILQIGAGWYGGQYIPMGGSGVGGASYASHMTVNNYGEAMTVAKHQQVQRQADVRTRTGRPR